MRTDDETDRRGVIPHWLRMGLILILVALNMLVFLIPDDENGIRNERDLEPVRILTLQPEKNIFRFSTQNSGAVRLELFNLLGESVAEPEVHELPPGVYGWDIAQLQLPPGIYFFRISSAGRRITIKTVIGP